MTKRTMRIVALAVTAVVLTGALYAQSSARGRSRSRTVEHSVTITTDGPRALVVIDGQDQQGATPMTVTLPAGEHQFVLVADGYREWRRTISISSDTTIRADMAPETYSLRVQPNIGSAQVFINGRRIGNGNVAQNLAPGRYEIRISAPGFLDFSATVTLDGDEVVRASLRPAPARVIVDIPDDIIAPGVRDAVDMVRVFINGRLQVGREFELEPGRHSIRLASGGWSVEQTYIFDAGETYRIVPNLTLSVSIPN